MVSAMRVAPTKFAARRERVAREDWGATSMPAKVLVTLRVTVPHAERKEYFSDVVIHRKLKRMGSQANLVGFSFALVPDPGRDDVFSKHAAAKQELLVALKAVNGIFQRTGRFGDTL